MSEWEQMDVTFAGLPIMANGNKRRILDKNGSVIVEYDVEAKA